MIITYDIRVFDQATRKHVEKKKVLRVITSESELKHTVENLKNNKEVKNLMVHNDDTHFGSDV